MGVSGALAIADALRINTSISHLVVDLEKVGKEEVTLQYIYFFTFPFLIILLQAMTIAAAIRANPTLTELNIGEDTSEIDEEILNAISSTLKLNRYVAGISEETGFSEYVLFWQFAYNYFINLLNSFRIDRYQQQEKEAREEVHLLPLLQSLPLIISFIHSFII